MFQDILTNKGHFAVTFEEDTQIKSFVDDNNIPQIDSRPFSNPNFSFDLSHEEVEKLFFGAIGDHFSAPNITLDLSKVADRKITLYDPSCEYVRFHGLQIAFIAGNQPDWRQRPVQIIVGNDSMDLHTLTLMVAPTIELTSSGRLILKGRAVITFAQNRDWAHWVFLAIRDRIRAQINPGLPNPLFQFDITDLLPQPLPPALRGQAHFSVHGCYFDAANPPVLRTEFKAE